MHIGYLGFYDHFIGKKDGTAVFIGKNGRLIGIDLMGQ
jgi:hypothetical protein